MLWVHFMIDEVKADLLVVVSSQIVEARVAAIPRLRRNYLQACLVRRISLCKAAR